MALWSKKSTTPAPGAQAPETPPAPQAAQPPPARSEPAQPPQLMTPPPQAPAPAEATQSELSEEAKRNAAMLSKSLMAALGQIVTVLMRTAEHRAKPLTDLEWLAIPAVMTGQFAVVEAQSKANGMTTPISLMMWAFVSPEVDQRLRADPNEPIRLSPNEWKSGDILWIVEAIGEQKLLQAMLQNAVVREWNGRPANLRVRGPDGAYKIAVIKPRPPGEQPPA